MSFPKGPSMLHVSERKRLYSFIARLFSYPDAELLAALQDDDAALAARVLGEPPPDSGKVTVRDLEVAYTDLFINRLGGAPAPPYGSVYLEEGGQLMGQTSLHAGEAYRAEGLSLGGSGEPPDFLSTELEFLYYLVTKEEDALGRKDIAAAREALRRQADFCRALLHPWIPLFCRKLAEDEEGHPFYLWGGRLLEEFCRLENDWLERLT